MSKVTVLVAAYNAEKYLEECLDSLVGQTLKDIQIVCIDDGSTDSTPQILDRYASKDSRIRILTEKVNSGLAVARNHGIGVADGQYITMVDADDLLSADALERAASVLDANQDMGSVLFKLMLFDGDGERPYPVRSQESEWSAQEAFELSIDWGIHGLYVSRTQLFRDYPYDASSRLYSDENTSRIHFLHSGRVGSCSGVYYYRQHGESMTHQVSVRRLDLVEANTSLAHQIKSEGQSREIRAFFEKKRWINLTGICGFWLEHKELADRDEALARFRTAWNDIDKSLLPRGLKMKFGYIPCHSFRLYFLQIEFYFLLRRLLGK